MKLTKGEEALVIRHRLRMTQKQAAQKLGICHVTLRRMERDERDATPLLKMLKEEK